MAKVVLISCTSRKRAVKAKAKYMYDKSPLFRKSLEYAELLKPDKIFILSAKYGLLSLEKEIEPYNVTLNYLSPKQKAMNPKIKVLSREERKKWSKSVINQLRTIVNSNKDKFIFLAPKNYREFLMPHITDYEIPMEHIDMFNQQTWLSKKISFLENQK